MRPNILASILLAMLFAASSLLAASANGFYDIARQAQTGYAAAQESWQRGVAELVTRTNPDFRKVATVYRDLQLAYIEQSTARFRYLLEHDLHRIVLTNGLSQFANFEWSDKDTKALTESDPKYVQLQQRLAALEKSNNEEPNWPQFRAWFRDTLSTSRDYESLLSAFQARQKAVEAVLGKYKPE